MRLAEWVTNEQGLYLLYIHTYIIVYVVNWDIFVRLMPLIYLKLSDINQTPEDSGRLRLWMVRTKQKKKNENDNRILMVGED